MKIEINVLPDTEKEKIKEEKKIGFALKLAFSFIAVLLLLNATLFFVQITLRIEYQAAKKSSETTSAKNIGKENQLKEVFEATNSQVANFSRIKSNILGTGSGPDFRTVPQRNPDESVFRRRDQSQNFRLFKNKGRFHRFSKQTQAGRLSILY